MNAVEFTTKLNKMPMDKHIAVLTKYGIDAFENPAETEYFSKYLLTGERKGLDTTANVVQARIATTKLFKDMPHLATKYNGENAEVVTTKAVKTKAVKTKAPKVAKVKVAKTVYADGSVFFRADRNKWMAVLGGKPVAARDTKEKALEFLAKKGVQGTIVE